MAAGLSEGKIAEIRNELLGMGFVFADCDRAFQIGCTDTQSAVAYLTEGIKPRAAGIAAQQRALATSGHGRDQYPAAQRDSNVNTTGREQRSGGLGVADGASRGANVSGGAFDNHQASAGGPSKRNRFGGLPSFLGVGGSSNNRDSERAASGGGGSGGAPSSHSAASGRGGGRAPARRVQFTEDNSDAELRQAMELSSREAQDRELQSALELSARENNIGGATAGSAQPAGADANDPDLKRAIEQSLRDAPSSQAQAYEAAWTATAVHEDPRERRRVFGEVDGSPSVPLPVGLRNIGNTCYLNSLLQVYFNLPAFRRAVFRYRTAAARAGVAGSATKPGSANGSATLTGAASPGGTASGASKDLSSNVMHATSGSAGSAGPQGTDDKAGKSGVEGTSGHGGAREAQEVAAEEFVVELQRLFARMALGNQKYADPSDLVSKMRDANGNPVVIGGQQDADEFNGLFLDIVERALAVCPTSCLDPSTTSGEPETNAVKQMFTAGFHQRLSFPDASDAAIPRSTDAVKESTVALHVDATGDSNRELYCGLDDYTYTKIDYTVSATTSSANRGTPACSLDGESADVVSGMGSVGSGHIFGENVPTDSVARENGKGSSPQTKHPVDGSVSAMKSVWFTHFAPVLTVYILRVRWAASQAEKVHAKYKFQTEIAIDRYLEENRESSEIARETVRRIRVDRVQTQSKLDQYRMFPCTPSHPTPASLATSPVNGQEAGTVAPVSQPDHSVVVGSAGDEMSVVTEKPSRDSDSRSLMDTSGTATDGAGCADELSVALARARQRVAAAALSDDSSGGLFSVDGVSAKEAKLAMNLLDSIAKHDETAIQGLKEKLNALDSEEDAAFRGLDRTKYCLHAVLVHDGEPSSGHYWTFIRNRTSTGVADQWLKFNDMSVTKVSDDDMLGVSMGGTGYASAYCLIYTLKNWDGGIDDVLASVAKAKDAMDTDPVGISASPVSRDPAEEGRRLLPPERIVEVEASNAKFDQEVRSFVAKKETEERNKKARSIIESAVAAIRISTESLQGLPSAEIRVATGLDDVVAGRSCGIRSLVEFCLAIGSRPGALTHALINSWYVYMSESDESEQQLLLYLQSRAHTLSSYPPLSEGKVTAPSDGVKEPEASLLVKELSRLLSHFSTEFAGDAALVPRDSSQEVIDALSGSQALANVRANAYNVKVYFKFARRAACVLRAAMEAARDGRLIDCIGLCLIVLQQKHSDMYVEDGSEDEKTMHAVYVSEASMRFARRDEEVLRFLPSFLASAFQLLLSNRSEQSSFDAHALKYFVTELAKQLENRIHIKKTSAAMSSQSKVVLTTENSALSFAKRGLASVKNVPAQSEWGFKEAQRIRSLALNASKEAREDDETGSDDTVARKYETVRDFLCQLGCDKSETSDVEEASARLLQVIKNQTAAA